MVELNYRSKGELQKDYSVFGWFYDIKSKGKYRSVLEIHRNLNNNEIQPYLINKHRIDLVVVMMNPGGSEPANKKDIYHIDETKELDRLYEIKEVVPTNPDLTQFQLMRVMDSFTTINCVRVLNLSDISEVNSTDLPKQLKNLDHSLFLGKRNNELNAIFPKSTPVLLAYGGIDKLKEAARQVHKFIGDRTILGVTESGKELYYQHPLRRYKRNAEWVNAIVNQIRSKSIFK